MQGRDVHLGELRLATLALIHFVRASPSILCGEVVPPSRHPNREDNPSVEFPASPVNALHREEERSFEPLLLK